MYLYMIRIKQTPNKHPFQSFTPQKFRDIYVFYLFRGHAYHGRPRATYYLPIMLSKGLGILTLSPTLIDYLF